MGIQLAQRQLKLLILNRVQTLPLVPRSQRYLELGFYELQIEYFLDHHDLL